MKNFLLFIFLIASSLDAEVLPQKILICGVGQNVAPFALNTITCCEELGSHFSDYRVIFYENNSTDETKKIFASWQKRNPHVTFLSQTIDNQQLAKTRTERIASARNKVLAEAKNFEEFEFLLMVDLDFATRWPVEEICKTCQLKEEWDGIFANGLREGIYYDRFAMRDEKYPLGPELLGDHWWFLMRNTPMKIEGEKLYPVNSAFGGLGIYKTKSVLPHTYSGVVTADLSEFVEKKLQTLPPSHPFLQFYLQMNAFSTKPHFRANSGDDPKRGVCSCCEHVPLHASMILAGHGRFFINPKLVMQYQ